MAEILGTPGDDSLTGTGTGADTVFGFQGRDTVAAGDGNDLVYGNQQGDSLLGERGDDTLWAASTATGSWATRWWARPT